MGRRQCTPEPIIHMLREAEFKLAGGKTIGGFAGNWGSPGERPPPAAGSSMIWSARMHG
jgi:hypothetical protein